MTITVLSKFYKDLDKIKTASLQGKVLNVIESAKTAESIYEIKNIKKLRGDKISYRVKLGDYRIGIYFENGIFEFARIVHRKNIYKVFP